MFATVRVGWCTNGVDLNADLEVQDSCTSVLSVRVIVMWSARAAQDTELPPSPGLGHLAEPPRSVGVEPFQTREVLREQLDGYGAQDRRELFGKR
jgi:hypothetical protein